MATPLDGEEKEWEKARNVTKSYAKWMILFSDVFSMITLNTKKKIEVYPSSREDYEVR